MADTDAGHPIATPLPQRLADFRRRRLPTIVWSLAALACVWMMAGRARHFEHIGLARALQYQISAGTTGRVETVVFDLYDQVREGDILAKLDDTELGARIESAQAAVRKIGAQIEAERATLRTSGRESRSTWVADLRRFQTDEERLRLSALDLRVQIQGDEIERERLALQVQRARPLLEQGLIGQAQYDEIRLSQDQVVQRLADNRQLIDQTDREYRMAQERRRNFESELPAGAGEETMLQPLREAIDVEQGLLRQIEAQREALVLRSPVAGQVSAVACSRGQTVMPGEPMLTVTERSVADVVAWIDEQDGTRVEANSPVLLSSLRRPERVAESVVLRVGPQVEALPPRLWRQPSVPQYGRAVVIAAVPALDLVPGELLSVRITGGR